MQTSAKAALALTFLLGAGGMDAADAGNDKGYRTADRIKIGDRIVPQCHAADGQSVTYVITRSQRMLSPYTYSAQAGQPLPFNRGIPHEEGHYIVIPQKFINQVPEKILFHSTAHECAHQELGHPPALQEFEKTPEWQRQAERDADCRAPLIMLMDYGMKKEEIEDILAATFNSEIIRKHDNTDKPAHKILHDSAQERLVRSMVCLNYHAMAMDYAAPKP